MKQEIRERILSKISSMSPKEIYSKSMLIAEKIIGIIKENNRICVYVSTDKEVHTHGLIKKLLETKEVFAPFMEKEIKIARINNFDELERGTLGILEPKKEEYEGEVDVILVPGIAFDGKMNRIGRGLGYYDKFLQNKKALKIGLAFENQIVDKIFIESHDVPMDKIVTEKGVKNAKGS